MAGAGYEDTEKGDRGWEEEVNQAVRAFRIPRPPAPLAINSGFDKNP